MQHKKSIAFLIVIILCLSINFVVAFEGDSKPVNFDSEMLFDFVDLELLDYRLRMYAEFIFEQNSLFWVNVDKNEVENGTHVMVRFYTEPDSVGFTSLSINLTLTHIPSSQTLTLPFNFYESDVEVPGTVMFQGIKQWFNFGGYPVQVGINPKLKFFIESNVTYSDIHKTKIMDSIVWDTLSSPQKTIIIEDSRNATVGITNIMIHIDLTGTITLYDVDVTDLPASWRLIDINGDPNSLVLYEFTQISFWNRLLQILFPIIPFIFLAAYIIYQLIKSKFSKKKKW